MALDRQKILTELGSVISQLKSADCGCMGKLFENNRQMPSSAGNNFQHYGGHRPNCSECSHNMANNGYNNMHYPCMGGCNAPRLYSDTYNYLNENLMKPTVNEVYHDLKTITPENTIMNSPAVNKMNMNSGWEGGQGAESQKYKISNYNGQNAVPLNNAQMNHFSGVGPQIMNMLQGNNVNTASHAQVSQPLESGASQFSQNENNVTTSPAQFSTHYNMEQSNPKNQFMNQQNLTANTCQQNLPNAQPVTPINTNQHSYGHHTQGIAKFNEMFPGIMSKDLGFDPMKIAIQMNPANQQQAAMQSMHDIMNNYTHKHDNSTYNNNLQQPQMANTIPQQPQMANTIPHMQAHSKNSENPSEPNYANQLSTPNSNINTSGLGQTNPQVYSGLKDPPTYQQKMQPQMQQPMQYQQGTVDNSNVEAVTLPPNHSLQTVNESNELAYEQTAKSFPNNMQNMNEPIYPVDTTKNMINQNYAYNTLGQPVKMLPANAYITPVPSLPQTLSPQPTMKYNSGASKYSNVKSTESKTSLFAKQPVGRTPSRNQLQQMYNQYKGSMSYTQQNLKDGARSRETNSDGRLHAAQINTNAPKQIPIEKIGGDNAINNPIQDQVNYKTGQVMEQIGDAPITKPINDTDPIINRKCRNGLQDMTFTSYPTSAAWSFHGCDRAAPSAKYRYRNRF